MKIIYKKISGKAINLEFKQDNYILKSNEIDYGTGDILPDIDILHDLSHLKILKKEEINKNVTKEITKKYSSTNVLKLLRKGISNNNNLDWIDYNNFCEEKILKGKIIKNKINNIKTKSELKKMNLSI